MQVKLDHIGYITNDIAKFESFWVKIVGFKKVWESRLSDELVNTLFNKQDQATCIRYELGDMVIELHKFDKPTFEDYPTFIKYGINHIALHVDSREKWLKGKNIYVRRYHNPKGWDNIFIQDFEGNWIELKETL